MPNRQLLRFLLRWCRGWGRSIAVLGSCRRGCTGIARTLVLDLLDLLWRGRVGFEGDVLPLLGRLESFADGLDQLVEAGCDGVFEELWG